jgi:predicted nucleic acid-binding protein
LRVYLDTSCLNRPFDDQSQARIRLESEAVVLILERIDRGDWEDVSSEMARIEVDAIPDEDRRGRVWQLLPEEEQLLKLDEAILERAVELQAIGFKSSDAVHIAAAEELGADALLTCDDRLNRRAKRYRKRLNVHVANPCDWLQEIENAENPNP